MGGAAGNIDTIVSYNVFTGFAPDVRRARIGAATYIGADFRSGVSSTLEQERR